MLAWTLSNGALVAAIISTSAGESITATKVNVYMAFLLYSVAGLAAFRFVGCTMCELRSLSSGDLRGKANASELLRPRRLDYVALPELGEETFCVTRLICAGYA